MSDLTEEGFSFATWYIHGMLWLSLRDLLFSCCVSVPASLCPCYLCAISVISLWYLYNCASEVAFPSWYLCEISAILLQRQFFLPISLLYLCAISVLSIWYLRVIYIWYPCELVFWKRRSALLKLENNLAMWPLLFQSLTHLQIWIYRMSLLIPACWI